MPLPAWTPERIQQAIDKQPEPDGCWLWTGPVRLGMPSYTVGRLRRSVRRTLWDGAALDPTDVLYPVCGTSRCVRASHTARKSRRCPVCAHPHRHGIDQYLVAREVTLEALGVQFGLGQGALGHHWRWHHPVGRADALHGRRRATPSAHTVAARDRRERAAHWLRELLLEHGQVLGVSVYSQGAELGFNKNDLYHAFRMHNVRRVAVEKSTKGRPLAYAWRLPTEAEIAQRQAMRRTPSLAYKPSIKTDDDVQRVVRARLVTRRFRWSNAQLIKGWVGTPFHDQALAAAEKLHQTGWAEKLVTAEGVLIGYRHPPITGFERSKPDGKPVLVVANAKMERGTEPEPTDWQIARHANLIESALRKLDRKASTNDLHNHLGSSRRGDPRLFNAALDKLVADGRVRRTTEGRTNYYEVVDNSVLVT